MKVEVFESFGRLRATHGGLLAYPSVDNYFLSLDWFENLASHGLPDGTKPRVYVLEHDGKPQAVLYCAEKDGRQLMSLTTYYTCEYAPVLVGASIDPADSLHKLLAFIAAERPHWSSIELRYLRADAKTTDLLASSMDSCSFPAQRFEQYDNWYATITSLDYAEFYAARPSQLRNTIKRKHRKLEREHALAMSLIRAPGEELERAIDSYTRVYESSWKRPEPFVSFVPNLIRSAARCGALRLGEIRIDDAPAASQIWITTSTRGMIYKLAYDERFKEHSPGSILSAFLFQRAIDEDRVGEIDYGVGSEPYKKDWMSASRKIIGLFGRNTATLPGRLAAAADRAKRLFRSDVDRS